MRLSGLLLLLVLAGGARAAAAQGVPGDAYLDDGAREMVREGRARRALLDRRIQSYTTTVLERARADMKVGIAHRTIFRRETAARVDWTHDTVRIEVLGAREVVPIADPDIQVPHNLRGWMPSLAFDPVDSEMLLRLESTSIRHPFAAGSEAHYRFRSGDSTVIQLPDGRTVRLRELRILPRRRDTDLMTGSFWLDAATFSVVQAYFRPVRGYDSKNDPDSDTPFFLPPIRAEFDFIAIEYGLWDLRWWLPRLVAVRGGAQVGAVRAHLSYERRYSDYTIVGDTLAAPPVPGETPAIEHRPCRPRNSFALGVRGDDENAYERDLRADSIRLARRDSARAYVRARAAEGDTAAMRLAATICDREFIVTTAPDTVLLGSELLPGGIFEREVAVLTDAELSSILDRARALPGAPWQLESPAYRLPLLRYNRIEGLAIGGRVAQDFGPVGADVAVHVATAELDASAELGLERHGYIFETRVAAYRRLDALDVSDAPHATTSSISALVFGNDDNDWFRATGAELRVQPPPTHTQWYSLRVFAEAQRAVAKQTDFSVRHLLDDDHDFRPNLTADRANQVGSALALRAFGGADPTSLRWATELVLHGETGDYSFTRPSVHVRALVPLLRLQLGVEGAAGSSFGDAPAQRLWQLGGASTVRGYGAARLRGEAFWRGSVELGTSTPLARVAIFGDAGWAGPRDDFSTSRPIHSVGFGLGFLDGLLRVDVARALDAPDTWRLHLRTNGLM